MILDLTLAADCQAFRRLAATADVVVESLRPGAMDRLGLGADSLNEINPRLVVVSCPAYPPGIHQSTLSECADHEWVHVSVLSGLPAKKGLDEILGVTGAPSDSELRRARFREWKRDELIAELRANNHAVDAGRCRRAKRDSGRHGRRPDPVSRRRQCPARIGGRLTPAASTTEHPTLEWFPLGKPLN